MNYILMMGGLGNQFFQYTFMKYLEKIKGLECSLHLDYFDAAIGEESITDRAFELEKYHCNFIPARGKLVVNRIVDEGSFRVDEDYRTDECYFRGYWQNKKYFLGVREDVTRELTLKDEYISQAIRDKANEISQEKETVAVHIRRGDYLNENNRNLFNSLSNSYYEAAIECIQDYFGPDLKIYLFTDDYEYVSNNMQDLCGYSCEVIRPGKPYEDLLLMQKAKHHVIANSTYSWWGAALSPNGSTGMVIYPRKWYHDRPNPDLFLDKWIGM